MKINTVMNITGLTKKAINMVKFSKSINVKMDDKGKITNIVEAEQQA